MARRQFDIRSAVWSQEDNLILEEIKIAILYLSISKAYKDNSVLEKPSKAI